MNKYHLLLWAGRQYRSLYQDIGIAEIALISIHHKPLLDWVLEAYHGSDRVLDIFVIGPEDIERCASMRYVRQRIHDGESIWDAFLQAAHLFTSLLWQWNLSSDKHSGFIVSFCDTVFLTPSVINHLLNKVDAATADCHLFCLPFKYLSEAGFPDLDEPFKVGDIWYYLAPTLVVRKAEDLVKLVQPSQQQSQAWHELMALIRRLMNGANDIPALEKRISEYFDVKIGVHHVELVETVMAIRHQSQLEWAKSQLPDPWQHQYRQAHLIYNPRSAQGMPLSPFFKDLLGIRRRKFDLSSDRKTDVARIRDYFFRYGIEPQIHDTKYAGHAIELARQAVVDGADLIIAVGGDGTINEVINGLAGSKTVLGVIPFGTANVFGLEMKIPVELEAACQVIASGRTICMDLGKANDRYFACMAGIGFDAHVLRRADSKLKKIYGALAYVMVGLRSALTYRWRRIKVKIDDQPLPRQGYYVVVGNGKYYAGDMMFARFADLNDGLLDVCIFKHRNVWHVLRYLFGRHRGDIDRHMTMEYFQCRKIEILRKGRHPVHVDAEYLSRTPVTIQCQPQALTVAV